MNVGVDVGVSEAVFLGVGVGTGTQTVSPSNAFTHEMIEPTLTQPGTTTRHGRLAHAVTAALPSAMLTTRMSSEIETLPSSSQSQGHCAAASCANETQSNPPITNPR